MIVLAVGLSAVVEALAALPRKSLEELKAQATHVVVGRVEAVYSTERASGAGSADRHYVVELTVTAVEKGEGPREGRVVYAKCWQPAKRPAGWTGGQGQDEVPAAGKVGRLYLAEAKDGTYSLLTPNGWAEEKR